MGLEGVGVDGVGVEGLFGLGDGVGGVSGVGLGGVMVFVLVTIYPLAASPLIAEVYPLNAVSSTVYTISCPSLASNLGRFTKLCFH